MDKFEKDLNIYDRLGKLENKFENMKKRGQTVNLLDLIKIAAIIIIGYVLFRAITSIVR